jgi:hypothetical protein
VTLSPVLPNDKDRVPRRRESSIDRLDESDVRLDAITGWFRQRPA